MNRVIITGNLGSDPTLRATGSGLAVANISVATNERVKQDGEWVDHTEWHNIVVFGGQADSCGKFLAKGSKVAVEGKLRTRAFTDRNGNERKSTEIVADRVEFMTKAQSSSAPPPTTDTVNGPLTVNGYDNFDDNLF
jgi:single-strand DNA-binding protein|tara:strand:+ start:969 stop:1379 length:411 start_codon:yes stop_codon:yes gene_type:complete